MKQQDAVFKQGVLIDRFNEFARLAKDYLGIEIAPLNEGGCCFALAQYNIKHAREKTLEEFYHHIGYITAHFSDKGIIALLEKAKPTLTSEQEKSLLFNDRDATITQSILYNDFQFHDSPYSFDDLMKFMQGISKAQVGYESLLAKGKFAKEKGQFEKGRFEHVTGNWDRSLPLFGDSKTILAALQKSALSHDQYAMIVSGNHAINYRRTADQRFVVYDSNDPSQSKILNSLEEVAETIIAAFDKVGCLTKEGEVGIVIDTLSFADGDLELHQAMEKYADKREEYGVKGSIAEQCHEILIDIEENSHKALAIYELYKAHQARGQVKNMQDFIKPLPAAMQDVVTECFNYVRKAAFSESVEDNKAIVYQDTGMTENQKSFMSTINEYFTQYHDGHISRTDFALNVLRQIVKFMASPEAQDFRALDVYPQIMDLKKNLSTYLEDTVTATKLIESTQHINLNKRDSAGFNLVNHVMQTGPNKATIQALFEQGEPFGKYQFDSRNHIDRATLQRLLSFATTDTVEY
ncbi:MAG: hypothetical protein M3R00_07395, partial [Pseudomonadota bacterium]|nr:hypothetical protein [Pseudomonadota bacterium]